VEAHLLPAHDLSLLAEVAAGHVQTVLADDAVLRARAPASQATSSAASKPLSCRQTSQLHVPWPGATQPAQRPWAVHAGRGVITCVPPEQGSCQILHPANLARYMCLTRPSQPAGVYSHVMTGPGPVGGHFGALFAPRDDENEAECLRHTINDLTDVLINPINRSKPGDGDERSGRHVARPPGAARLVPKHFPCARSAVPWQRYPQAPPKNRRSTGTNRATLPPRAHKCVLGARPRGFAAEPRNHAGAHRPISCDASRCTVHQSPARFHCPR